jgi:hypothetical protein
MTTQVTIALPDGLAKEATQAGLLSAPAIEGLSREEIRRRALKELHEAMDRMAAVDQPPMTEQEIQGEIDGVRSARQIAQVADAINASDRLTQKAPA